MNSNFNKKGSAPLSPLGITPGLKLESLFLIKKRVCEQCRVAAKKYFMRLIIMFWKDKESPSIHRIILPLS